METPQDKIREFFWELDKVMGPNHPFIVLHGPADKFREYLEDNLEDTEKMQELEQEKEELEDVAIGKQDTIDNLKETVTNVIDALKSIDADKDSREEIQVEIETIIKELKAAM